MKKNVSVLRALCSPYLLIAILMAIYLMFGFSGLGGSEEKSMTQLEMRVGEALEKLDGVEHVDVVIRTRRQNAQNKALNTAVQSEEIPCGAIVVAQGTDDPIIRVRLTQALCALLGLRASEVEVIGVSGEVN